MTSQEQFWRSQLREDWQRMHLKLTTPMLLLWCSLEQDFLMMKALRTFKLWVWQQLTFVQTAWLGHMSGVTEVQALQKVMTFLFFLLKKLHWCYRRCSNQQQQVMLAPLPLWFQNFSIQGRMHGHSNLVMKATMWRMAKRCKSKLYEQRQSHIW